MEVVTTKKVITQILQKLYHLVSTLDHGNLAPMLGVLHGITDKPETVQYLAQKCNLTTTPSDIQSIQERLRQQLGSKAFLESANAANLANQNKVPKIFQDRKLLTLDFVTDYKEDILRDVGPLSCVPVSSQESAIVQDLLYCFVGINGVHVSPVKKADKITFNIDPKVNPTLRELLKRITPLCHHYSTVVSFVERHTLIGSGCVNQALAQALGDVLKDYYVFVAQLETQHRVGMISHKMSLSITIFCHKLLHKFLQKISDFS